MQVFANIVASLHELYENEVEIFLQIYAIMNMMKESSQNTLRHD